VKPLCYILTPFGRKPAPSGAVIDFDRVRSELIEPAVEAAGLEPVRADEETIGGIIHKPMFERLILCPYAVADLTLANANLFYELGIRHSFRPSGTVPVIAHDSRPPFDLQMLRFVQYMLAPDGAPEPAQIESARQGISSLLADARTGSNDSPVFQMLAGLQPPQVTYAMTDTFRATTEYLNQLRARLAAARKSGVEAVRNIENELGAIDGVEPGSVIDLFLSYRAVSAWEDMVRLYRKMAPATAETALVQEQLGLALNRLNRRLEAELVLSKLIEEHGPSSETLGILGRVYRDGWEDAQKAGNEFLAHGYLAKAIEAYLAGFEADWRDAYPGVNAVTLMEIHDPPDTPPGDCPRAAVLGRTENCEGQAGLLGLCDARRVGGHRTRPGSGAQGAS
jgi:hypothetical protein